VSSQIQDDQEKPCVCCLQEALREYSGTVIAVSHDRYFLRQIVNRVVEVKNEELIDYVGDYNYYLEQNLEARRRELEREEELEAKAPTVKAKSKMSKVFHCHKANF
jgi:ATPase subunit of ABC transporter with duplicated ATPase domains